MHPRYHTSPHETPLPPLDVYLPVCVQGNEAAFTFLETVLDQVITQFPCPYIHIGGDEVPKVGVVLWAPGFGAWLGSCWEACRVCGPLASRARLAIGTAGPSHPQDRPLLLVQHFRRRTLLSNVHPLESMLGLLSVPAIPNLHHPCLPCVVLLPLAARFAGRSVPSARL